MEKNYRSTANRFEESTAENLSKVNACRDGTIFDTNFCRASGMQIKGL